jgi:hypothetical protein
MAPADVELAVYARRGLLLRLQHHSDSGVRIDAELVDAAGGLPRCDSYCIASVKLHGLPAATVVDVDADVHFAIDRAADPAGRLAEEQVRQAGSPQAPQPEAVAA